MLQDLRHAVRSIARSKSTTAVVLLSLGLGTGMNAAVSTALNGLLIGGAAGVRNPSNLVDIYTAEFSGLPYGPSSYPDYASIRAEATSFAAVAAVDDNVVDNLQIGDAVQSGRIAAVSQDYFSALELRAEAGRLLQPADATLKPPPAVVSFNVAGSPGGAAAVVGKMLTIDGREYQIVGVTPPRFRGLHAGRECDAWVPMTRGPEERGDRRLSIVARLAAGVSRAAAEGELRQLSSSLADRFPGTNRGDLRQPDAPRLIVPVRYSQMDPAARGQMFIIGLIVGGATLLLLASACLNVGSLLLARAAARRHELAIKKALGATRGRLVRQLIAETLCLSCAGGAIGLLFTFWTAEALPALFMAGQAEQLDTQLDLSHLLPTVMTLGVACIAGAIFGVAPAVQGTAAPEITALRADAGGVSAEQGGRLRALLVGSQLSLSILLLLSTSLLITSLKDALEGPEPSVAGRVAFISIELPGQFGDTVRGVATRDRLLQRAESVPGVESVGWTSTLPLGRGNRLPFHLEGSTSFVLDMVEFDTNVVSAGFFPTMSLPCIEGRLFTDNDRMLSPHVVVVDELLARRYFGATAVGRDLWNDKGERVEIVGVVRTGRYRTLQSPPQPTVYFPMTQDYLYRGHLLVRTARDPAVVLEQLRASLNEAADGAALGRSSTLTKYLLESVALDRLATTLVGVCGVIALAMATIGVYGVMTDAVARRTREIGLRMALGAGWSHVVRLVFTEVLHLTVGGLMSGTLLTIGMTYVARRFLFAAPSLDVFTVLVVAVALVVVVIVAAVVPLRRALAVSPNVALRTD
jgi:predicted permease